MTRTRAFLFLLIFSFTSIAFSSTDHTRRWEDESLNSSRLIVKYYRAEQIDTVRMVLQYWENRCGLNEPLLRIKILLAIEDGSFDEKIYDARVMGYLMKYRLRVDKESEIGNDAWKMRHSSTPGNLPKSSFVSDAFNKLTMNLAIRQEQFFKSGDPRRFFCEFYNHEFDTALRHLQQKEYAETSLQKYANEYWHKAQNRIEEHYALFGGNWMPSGKLNTLGNHPFIGVAIGLKKFRWLLDITGEWRMREAKNNYQVGSPTGVTTTNTFNGGYMGVEFGREIWQNFRHEFDLRAGAGFEGFDALTGRGANEDVSLSSQNINFGATYRFFLQPCSANYIGLQLQYAMIDYDSGGGSDLSGNSVSLRILFGKARNSNRWKILQSFGH